MAGQDGRPGSGGAVPAAEAEAVEAAEADEAAVAGPLGAVLLAFEQVAVTAEAARVREAGADTADSAAGLVAALEEASAAAAGMGAGARTTLLTGPALAECAALLARRAREHEAESRRIAQAMVRAAGLLVEADEEVARSVAGATG
ncbi:hypothetical protein [Dietzia sp. B32]|uniref:hypothetical protein n=1 Tax=Dietzia sp. B32 TaxID=2915130 RepID=UPI0021ADD007|nr:hypothetical protein [Dietzia sp. B32]UVE96638.1 hypothetical protein L8M95_07720 [Dietzia sp. B32]